MTLRFCLMVVCTADGDLIYSFCKGPRFSSRKATMRQMIQHHYSRSIIALVPTNVDVARSLVVSCPCDILGGETCSLMECHWLNRINM